jgi:hypothetical protein
VYTQQERINFNNAEDNFLSFMKYLHPHGIIYAEEKFLSKNIHEQFLFKNFQVFAFFVFLPTKAVREIATRVFNTESNLVA